MSIMGREIARTPFAVIDVETTGLDRRCDRIIEIAVVVVVPGEEPRLVLDTLVHPERAVAATEVHGLTDADVAGAPTFASVAEIVVAALANRVVAAHNAAYDLSLLAAELERCGYRSAIPHVCTVLLPRVLDPTVPALSLRSACVRHGLELGDHRAANDAMAAARLLAVQVRSARRKVGTFSDLRARAVHPYSFLESFEEHMLPPPPAMHSGGALRPRNASAGSRRRGALAEYLEAVLDAAADLALEDDELAAVRRAGEGLAREQTRAVHARVFAAMLARFVEDTRIDRVEARRMEQLRGLLSALGWAPGDPTSTVPEPP